MKVKIKKELKEKYNNKPFFLGDILDDKIYIVLSEEYGNYRLFDESGEDYLYSKDFFDIVEEKCDKENNIEFCYNGIRVNEKLTKCSYKYDIFKNSQKDSIIGKILVTASKKGSNVLPKIIGLNIISDDNEKEYFVVCPNENWYAEVYVAYLLYEKKHKTECIKMLKRKMKKQNCKKDYLEKLGLYQSDLKEVKRRLESTKYFFK